MASIAHQLLSLCARPRLPEAIVAEVRRRAAALTEWPPVLALAEQHGVGPLLRHHLRTSGAAVPPDVTPQLAAVHLRHRRGNEVRLRALVEILDALDASGIEVRLLKGAALMFLVYGDPALRPVSDLDLLVPAREAGRAQDLLRSIGFFAREASAGDLHHHLPAAVRTVDGVTVQVELHRDALVMDGRTSLSLDTAREPPLRVDLHGRGAAALGPHEMLWHLCEHLVGPLPRPIRLIWIADVIGFAETFHDRLDWARLAREFPIVFNVLAFAHAVSPLPETVLRRVPGAAAAGGDRVDSALSWTPQEGVRAGGPWRQLHRTASPPAWWIELRYGRRAGAFGRLAARVRHAAVFGRAGRRRVQALLRR